MTCIGPGATHHLACECREREHATMVAGLQRDLVQALEAVARAERERDESMSVEAEWRAERHEYARIAESYRQRAARLERVVNAARALTDGEVYARMDRLRELHAALAALDGKEAQP